MEEYINDLVEGIENEKCILVVGPQLLANEGKTIGSDLFDYLKGLKDFRSVQFNYYEGDEFFWFAKPTSKTMAYMKLQGFYKEKLCPSPIHSLIAEIPFHLIVSLSPDLMLDDIFKSKNFDYTFDYYSKQRSRQNIEKPTTEKPLIYNFLGKINETSSLVFTFDDLFDYMEAILGEKGLPELLSIEFLNAGYMLFLGTKLDKWYFKLLLKLFKLHTKIINPACFDSEQLTDDVNSFYVNEYNITFISPQEEENIIRHLHQTFATKGKLRKPKPEPPTTAPVIYNINVTGNDNIVLQNVKASNVNLTK